jgi:hypothetical protein
MTVGALQENAILTEIAQQARAMLEQVAASLLEST